MQIIAIQSCIINILLVEHFSLSLSEIEKAKRKSIQIKQEMEAGTFSLRHVQQQSVHASMESFELFLRGTQ